MEPLMPSEVARLVYGYLKKEKNEDAAECFLKSSPHLTECFQMFKANRNFNIKVNGFNLHDIFDNFGSMCTMIEERIPESCESKTLLEKLQYLLDTNHKTMKKDKLVEKKQNMVDKCVGSIFDINDQGTNIKINIEANKNISEELLEIPSFTEIISNNVSKTKEIDTFNNETNITDEKNLVTFSSPCLSSMTQLIENNTSTKTLSKFEEKNTKISEINKQICSTPAKKNESTPTFSPKNIHNLNYGDQAEYHQIPEATSLDSMPGLSKEDRIKDGSVIIDTGELVDTFLNDQSLLEKIADTINKSFDAQKETDNILETKVLDPPTLEKALDSTQSDPQIKNILDEFLVFNVDNADIGKKACTNDQLDSIKSRLRSARKKDDVSSKLKKNNFNIPKHIVYGNEECMKVDNNIVLIHEGNIRTTVFENYDLLSNQLVLQSSDSYNFDSTKIEPGEDYFAKSDYVKIAPKITPMLKTHQASEKLIFPKRRRQLLEVPGIRSKFRRTNITRQPLIQTPKSIIIEVPNQNSFETQEKNHIKVNDIIRLPEVSSKVNNVIVHDTPDDILKPPKNKSMSTPRRRSTHIRCLDFSTPQPKNMTRNTRSKLFCDTPKKLEKCVEEPISSPLPKLQADWGSVNGFESMIKKESIKHWDTDIREMVGAGILTSDADGRKTRKKKTPRKKIKPVDIQNNSILLLKEQKKTSNISITTNELLTDVSNISESTYGLDEQDSNKPLLEVQKSLKEKQTKFPISLETLNNVTELYNKQSPIKSDSLNTLNELKSSKKDNEFPISLETPDKITELYNKQPPTISDSLTNINDKKSLRKQNEFLISLETPDKTTEFYTKQSPVKSDSLNNDNNEKSLNKQSEFTISLETPDKITEFNNKQLPIKSKSLKSKCANQIKLEQSRGNEEKNYQNQKINSSVLNIKPEITNQEKDTNFLKTFNNHNYSSTEKNSNKSTEPLKEQGLFDQTDTNKSNELNSPVKYINIEPVKSNLVETPYKCDDAAVDIPETPISKIIREYDPSKMITPLPCTPEHDDSLTETPLTKVFRETSYLNRPPISPFPPTPGNSMSVDTLIVPPEQDYVKTSNNTNCKMNHLKEFLTQPIQTTVNNESSTKSKKNKVKCTPLKSKLKMSTKSKVKNGLKLKSIEAKKKQVYESVKVELFGSDISTSPNSHELLKTNEQHKTIVINKKPQEEEKKSGFKPIPKRKSIESMSVVNVNGIENHLSNELDIQPTNIPFIKPIIVKCEYNNDNPSGKVKKTISKKIKKSMVHFDDPVEKFFKLSKSPTLVKSNNKNTGKIQNEITVNDNSEQLIGLNRYLNKTSSTVYNCSPKEKKIKIESKIKTSKLNNSDSNINYSEIYNVDKSSKNISINSNESKTNEKNNQKIKLSENCVMDVNKVSNGKENNTVHNKSIVPLESVQTMSIDDNISNPNHISENKTNISLDGSESAIVNHNSSVNNTSCVTVIYDDKLDIQINKICDPLNNIEYLKKPKVYEVITEDGEHEMVYLNVSETFTFLDIPSELKNLQTFDQITSPLITTNKMLDVTSKMESGELENDEEILMPVTSTPRDVEIKNEKDDRARRSPSFWDDSVHNYPIKHRDDRHRDTNRLQNKTHHKYDKKHRPNKFRYHDERLQFDSWNHFQRSHHQNVKREFREDSVKDKHRSKHKDEKRRSYHDYGKGRNRLEENERFSIPQRMSQNELQKSNRSEDIVKKATKRPADRSVYNKTPAKVSKVEHQRLLKNVDVDDFLSVVHGQK